MKGQTVSIDSCGKEVQLWAEYSCPQPRAVPGQTCMFMLSCLPPPNQQWDPTFAPLHALFLPPVPLVPLRTASFPIYVSTVTKLILDGLQTGPLPFHTDKRVSPRSHADSVSQLGHSGS
jgi:hypothetical protein